MSADDRLCQRCITQGKRTALLRQSEGLSHDKTLLNFDSSKNKKCLRLLIGASEI
jgi:hypothetical protein